MWTHHLKTIWPVNHQQDQICNLRNVDHGVEIIIAFDEGYSLLLPANDSNGAFGFVQRLLRVPPNETFKQRALSDTRGSDNSDNNRGRFFVRSTVYQGNVKTGLVSFNITATLSVGIPTRLWRKCLTQTMDVGNKLHRKLRKLEIQTHVENAPFRWNLFVSPFLFPSSFQPWHQTAMVCVPCEAYRPWPIIGEFKAVKLTKSLRAQLFKSVNASLIGRSG